MVGVAGCNSPNIHKGWKRTDGIVMIDTKNSTRLSKTILHDIIKSVINYYPYEIMDICRTIPKIKGSNILQRNYWIYQEARQEEINVNWRKADVVWFYSDTAGSPFYVVHEVKTGKFDPEEIYRKYHTGMTVQIWVWAFRENAHNTKLRPSMKVIPIEYISNFIEFVTHDSILELRKGSFI